VNEEKLNINQENQNVSARFETATSRIEVYRLNQRGFCTVTAYGLVVTNVSENNAATIYKACVRFYCFKSVRKIQ
jgi:hypothetical protein